MPNRPLRFCLVTSMHVSNNPRLVKEADALCEAGHEVRVVAVRARRDLAERDAGVVARRRWRLDCVHAERHGRWPARGRWLAGSVAQAVSRALFDAGARTPAVRDRAASRYVRPLAALAAARPADVVVGHTLQALPAAARAAARLDARLGFDVEDLHAGQLPDDPRHATERRLVDAVERAYLPRCDYLTASSEGIAEEVARLYGVPRPTVVLNCFPLHPAGAAGDGGPPPAGRPSLYWFSQVIGPDRGLEDVVRALGRVSAPAHLHVRGALSSDYRARLETLIADCGLAGRVHFLETAAPDDLVALAAEHDVGLASEPGFSRNNLLAASNKLFTYLAAGLAVVASDTPGQRGALADAGGAARLYAPGDPDALAARLNELLATPEALAQAKRAARSVAARRYAWEAESARLVEYLTGGRSARPATHA